MSIERWSPTDRSGIPFDQGRLKEEMPRMRSEMIQTEVFFPGERHELTPQEPLTEELVWLLTVDENGEGLHFTSPYVGKHRAELAQQDGNLRINYINARHRILTLTGERLSDGKHCLFELLRYREDSFGF